MVCRRRIGAWFQAWTGGRAVRSGADFRWRERGKKILACEQGDRAEKSGVLVNPGAPAGGRRSRQSMRIPAEGESIQPLRLDSSVALRSSHRSFRCCTGDTRARLMRNFSSTPNCLAMALSLTFAFSAFAQDPKSNRVQPSCGPSGVEFEVRTSKRVAGTPIMAVPLV
jgi:hypothetical protein